MYRVCSLSLSPKSELWPTADKEFSLKQTIEKMCVFVVLTIAYLRLLGDSVTNFAATVNCKNQKTEISSETIEM